MEEVGRGWKTKSQHLCLLKLVSGWVKSTTPMGFQLSAKGGGEF